MCTKTSLVIFFTKSYIGSDTIELTLETIKMDLDILINSKKVSVTLDEKDIYALTRRVECQSLSPLSTFRKMAHEQTIEFIKNNMDLEKVLLFETGEDNLLHCVKQAKEQGLFLEFGVFKGKSINKIAKLRSKNKIYGFDSFEGLPEAWDGYCVNEGYFATELPEVKENVELIKGYFNTTLPLFLNTHSDKISFMHIDCDLYSSTKIVLELTKERLQSGTIIVFDEYFNYPNWQNHEHKAFSEFCEKFSVKFDYISIGHQQLGVRIL